MFWLTLAIILFAGLAAFGIWSSMTRLQPWGMPLALVSGGVTVVLLLFVINFYVTVALLGLALVAAFRGRKDTAVAWARPAAYGVSGLLVVLCLGRIIYVAGGCAEKQQVSQLTSRATSTAIAHKQVEAGLKAMGELVAQRFTGAKVLVLYDGTAPEESEIAMTSLSVGFGDKATLVAREAVGPDPMNPRMPDGSPWRFTALLFDDLVAKHTTPPAACTLVICLRPLPADFAASKQWQRPPAERPRFVLADCPPALIPVKYLHESLVQMLILAHPEPNAAAKLPLEFTGRHGARMVVVDRENVDQVVEAYPDLLVSEPGAQP